MKAKINNIDELRLEINRLNALKKEQEAYLSNQYTLLKRKVETPARVFGAITSSIPGVDFVKGLVSSAGSLSGKENTGNKKDWLTRGIQLGLPFFLNRTLLKNSGWLKKSLVLLASETAAGQVTQDKVGSAISKVADFIRPKKKKKKHKDVLPFEEQGQDIVNFGIPPDSETY